MNLFTAINDAMRIAMKSDDSAIVFGEDVGFGGIKSANINHNKWNSASFESCR